MITVELTEDHIEMLIEGAKRWGHMAVGLKSSDGFTDVLVVHASSHRRGRPAKARAAQPDRQPRSPVDPEGTVAAGEPE